MQYDSPHFSSQQKEAILKALQEGKTISLITYVLGDEGESKLKFMIESVLEKYGKIHLMELIYTSAKELVANSTKAAIKRMIFQEMNLNIHSDPDYRKGMERFKHYMNERKFPAYRSQMKRNKFFIKISISHSDEYMRLYVVNNFSLIPVEEERVLEKFNHAKKYDNLFEFFMAHGDNTEGAGMGITMVEILLAQSGFHRENFKILSSKKANLTIARVEVPQNEESNVGSTPPLGNQLISHPYSLEEIKGVFY